MHIKNKNDTPYINTTIFGFWLYIMSDCILFASLFAMHAVLSGGIHTNLLITTDIFQLNFVFIETLLLLLSSLTCSTSMVYANITNLNNVKKWIFLTLFLGLCFVGMEIYEFHHLIINQYNPSRNAFFSSFFVLIGTHGIHVTAGLIWIIVMLIHLTLTGLTQRNLIRLQCLSLFWHFLDIIWICVFSEVYLIGALKLYEY